MKLHEFCNKNLVDEKIFIVPTKSIGMQMINTMAREGYPCANLKLFTIKGVAFEICRDYIHSNRNVVVDNIIGSNLILGILKELSTNEDFFFKKELIDSRTSEEVYKAIMELKYAGIDEFPTIKNLNLIFHKYQLKLSELNALDHCDIILNATELCENNNYKICIASNIEFNFAEEQLFKKFSSNNFIKIDMPVSVLEGHPRSYFFKESIKDDILKDKHMKFYKSYGAKEEISYIINDIKAKLIPLDDVVISYTNDKYIDLINLEFEINDLPINFGNGLSVEDSSTYRFISNLFNWASKYYSIKELKAMFFSGDIKTPFYSPKLYEYLIEERIIFGRKSYYEKLNLNGDYNICGKIHLNYKEEAKWINEFFLDIFDSIPEDGNFQFGEYLIKLQNLIEKYVKDTNKYDGASKDVILKTLSQIENISMDISVADYFDIIISYIRKNRILRSLPQPGFVFATDLKNAGYTGRDNIYLIGMDSESLSSKIIESPILLDLLRSRLSENLKFANDSYNSKKYKIKELLTADFKNISIGYSNFDTVEVKGKASSQIYSELIETCKVIDDTYFNEGIKIYGRDLVKSGSAFEVLAGCARKAYLAYKMGIKSKGEKDIRVEYWLDPLERGIIVHDILNRYFDLKMAERTEIHLREIINEECKILRNEKISILEKAFLKESDNIFEICQGMIKNSAIDKGWEILVNELTFGINKENKIFGNIPPIKIMIQDLELDIVGAIDRVDINNETNEINIIDYKTGNKNSFEKQLREDNDYSKTKKLQYYIYKKALEAIIKMHPIYKDYNIIKFSYIFDKSSIDILFDDEFTNVIENRISELLNLDILKEQNNIIYDPTDRETCMYCDYSSICMVDTNLAAKEVGD